MDTTQKTIAAIVIVAVLAVAAVGVGFAYTATTSNPNNSASADYLIVTQEKTETVNKYIDPMVLKDPTFNTVTSWAEEIADNQETQGVDEAKPAREIVTATITGLTEIVDNSGYYELGTNKITIANTNTGAASVTLPNFLFTMDLGVKTAYNTGDTSGYNYFAALVATDATGSAIVDALIPVDFTGDNAKVVIPGTNYFTNSGDTKKLVLVLQLQDQDPAQGIQIDKTKDYSKIINGQVTFTFTAEAGTLVATDTSVTVGGTPVSIPITYPTIGDESVTYASLDSSIATVSNDGKVTGVAAGQTYVKITVTVDQEEYFGYAKVTVTGN